MHPNRMFHISTQLQCKGLGCRRGITICFNARFEIERWSATHNAAQRMSKESGILLKVARRKYIIRLFPCSSVWVKALYPWLRSDKKSALLRVFCPSPNKEYTTAQLVSPFLRQIRHVYKHILPKLKIQTSRNRQQNITIRCSQKLWSKIIALRISLTIRDICVILIIYHALPCVWHDWNWRMYWLLQVCQHVCNCDAS